MDGNRKIQVSNYMLKNNYLQLFPILRETDSTCLLIGDPKEVQQRLIDFLSPIGHHHAAQFLSAVALNWQDPKANLSQTSSIPPTCTEEQMVNLLLINVISRSICKFKFR